MGINLQQLKTYTVGVLKGWLTNKDILDKISESETGNLLYDGKEITSGSAGNQQTITGKKMYCLWNCEDNSTDGIAEVNPTEEHKIEKLKDSLDNYDAVLMHVEITGDNDAKFVLCSNEYPVSVIEKYYGQDVSTVNVCTTVIAYFLSFPDAESVKTNYVKKTETIQLKVVDIYGIKYETVSEDPITEQQITDSITETVNELDTKNSQLQ